MRLIHEENRPVARFSVLDGQNTHFENKIFVFIICLKQICLGTKFGGNAPGGCGPGSRHKKIENHRPTRLISRVRTD